MVNFKLKNINSSNWIISPNVRIAGMHCQTLNLEMVNGDNGELSSWVMENINEKIRDPQRLAAKIWVNLYLQGGTLTSYK